MAPYTGFSKSRYGSPGGHLLNELEEELEAAVAEAALPVAPGPVALPEPPECAPVGFDMAALLHAVGGADLESVTSLTLKLYTQDSSLQRLGLCLPCLQELTLDGSQIASLRELGTGMAHLTILRVARCSLISLDGVSGLPALKELHAAHNPVVSDIWTCSSLSRLTVLDLSYTGVRSASHAGFLEPCIKLHSLSLLGSPGASAGPGYRAEVRRQLPRLHLLDGHPLSPQGAIPVNQDESSDEDEPIAADETGASALPETRRTRPASANTPNSKRELSARRVMSARPRANTGSFHAENVVSEEVPSTLTSGGVVCGSLATALRSLRPHQCWTTAQQETSSSTQQPSDELLDAARQWRNNYQRFRQENSGRWSEEDDVDQQQQDEVTKEDDNE